ncbi:TonB-dependent siderophore receptor [Thalassotalea sp. PP2-459]|uniref:TonB-dependent receptor plug domain-containing protein n=1 Tax=Thalassotalea sp. PP2-459 TaxID=1742724 RepID=UPI0009420504|nr:TonB-dependent receptor [Thalassotalea sp. PP2-459]OKY27343.1 hypothetical protein BI291_00505 [Thalassotalea sp. PP2-459]
MKLSINQLTKSIIITFPVAMFTPLSVMAENIEEIVVLGERSTERIAVANIEVQHSDISESLRLVAGANVNKNGALTGIAQYRGLYGDRISTKVGGQTVIGAGPNAMDTPLSYSPSIITKSIELQRGIASVTSGIETLGGAINTTLKQADFSSTGKLELSTEFRLGYQDNADITSKAALTNIGSENAAFMAYIDKKKADNLSSADDRVISPTGFTKTQSGFSTAIKFADNIIGINYHYNDTHDAGTPSLPMDIAFIYSHRGQLFGKHSLRDGELNWQFGFMDADHKMDNFQQRMNMMPNMYRSNHAESNSISFSIDWKNEALTLGVDGYKSDHNATITNPNNMMFSIKNFNDIEDQRISAFSEYQHQFSNHTVKFGARIKRLSADAGDVSHHMAMMNPTVKELVMTFNQADRIQHDTNTDVTFDWLFPIFNHTQVQLSLAQKQRAPSYQERYLWVPMEATAGLADGNTYLGNINLKSETAKQVNLGLTYQQDKFVIIADTFYTRIDDYIQGIPNMNMPVNMLAQMMMNSDTVLQFANVDAALSGLDGQIMYQFNEQWQLSSTVSYVRGKRKDIDDNLYRVAPLNGHIALQYRANNWHITSRFHAVSAQHKVANINNEQKSSGYSYIDLIGGYQWSNSLTLDFGITNLFDREYQDHLAAYNRVNGSDIPSMSRIPSTARNIWLAATFQF